MFECIIHKCPDTKQYPMSRLYPGNDQDDFFMTVTADNRSWRIQCGGIDEWESNNELKITNKNEIYS